MVVSLGVPIYRVFTVDLILEGLYHPGKQTGSHKGGSTLK